MFTDNLIDFNSALSPKQDSEKVIYDNNHNVNVYNSNGSHTHSNINVKLTQTSTAVKVKLRDTASYSFNYIATITWQVFETMKRDQSLEINYEEFQVQIIELLKQISTKEMWLRLEIDNKSCKMVFFEKSRIKSLIFLTVDLELADQKQIIGEMSFTILQLKEEQKALKTQLVMSKSEVVEKDSILKAAVLKNSQNESQFRKDLDSIQKLITIQLERTKERLDDQLESLLSKIVKLVQEIGLIKIAFSTSTLANAQLVQNLHNLRVENNKNVELAKEFNKELEDVRQDNNKLEETCCNLRLELNDKDEQLKQLSVENRDLRKDMKEATIILAQKTKANDELGKDLVQANQMLVNFNNYYDTMSKEINSLQESLQQKETAIKECNTQITNVTEEFLKYRTKYNAEQVNVLDHELFLAQKKIEELEKINREASKLNGLLTNKLASTNPS